MESITRPAILDGLSEETRRALLSDAGLTQVQAVFAVVPDPGPDADGATTCRFC